MKRLLRHCRPGTFQTSVDAVNTKAELSLSLALNRQHLRRKGDETLRKNARPANPPDRMLARPKKLGVSIRKKAAKFRQVPFQNNATGRDYSAASERSGAAFFLRSARSKQLCNLY